MANTLFLIQLPDDKTHGFGGERRHRRFAVFVNGVRVRSFVENTALDNYLIGRWLDDAIRDYIATMERALGCRCIRGRTKHTFSGGQPS